MRNVLNMLAIGAVALALVACNGVYKGMPGDGKDFDVVSAPAGMGQAVPVLHKVPR